MEAGSAADPQIRRLRDYKAVIYRTNVSGLASLEDYRVAFGALAAENREWLCAQLPLFEVLYRVCGLVTDVPMIALMHPPGEPLPAEIQHWLGYLEEVVTATGIQVLEARESTEPSQEDFSVRGRQDCAIAFLALGDVDGDAIRRLAWERHGDNWRHSQYVIELAAREGAIPRPVRGIAAAAVCTAPTCRPGRCSRHSHCRASNDVRRPGKAPLGLDRRGEARCALDLVRRHGQAGRPTEVAGCTVRSGHIRSRGTVGSAEIA